MLPPRSDLSKILNSGENSNYGTVGVREFTDCFIRKNPSPDPSSQLTHRAN